LVASEYAEKSPEFHSGEDKREWQCLKSVELENISHVVDGVVKRLKTSQGVSTSFSSSLNL
jgi:hypothetical protein